MEILPLGWPITAACNCTIDMASIGLVIIAPVLSFVLGYGICFMNRAKDDKQNRKDKQNEPR